MAEEQQFCLRWNNFQANITTQFETLRDEEDFVDVTLACEGQRIKAHKVVLSACSPYFKELFRSNPCKHPILFMRDVEFRHLQSLIEFMYAGEVNVAQAYLSSFLRTAESLQIRGLTEAPQRHKQDSKSQPDASPTSNSLIQQIVNPRSQSTSPRANSQNNTSSPEDEDDNEDDVLSQNSSVSPPPAKRSREDGENTSQHPSPSSSQPPDMPCQQETGCLDESPEIFEPKMELPDYGSDGDESKGAGFLGLDSALLENSFASLHGGLEMFTAGPSSQGFMGDPAQDAALAHHQKLHSLDPRPCPICNRMYSNLSNLRQHVRLIHNPQTVACPLCNKPFKTKLYLKRHLVSFHELQMTNNTTGSKPAAPTAATAHAQGSGQFYPPFISPQPEDKPNYHNTTSPGKSKDSSVVSNQEYSYQTQRPYHNPPHNGERSYTPLTSNNQELATYSTPQVSKEDGRNYSQVHEKNRFNSKNDNYMSTVSHNNNEFQSNFISQSIEHANNDCAVRYSDTNGQKTPPFTNPLSHGKNIEAPGFLGSDSHLITQEPSGANKQSKYPTSETHINDQELIGNDSKLSEHSK